MHRILRQNAFFAYKIKYQHMLHAEDAIHRLHMCLYLQNLMQSYPQLPFHILFSDEATFKMNGEVNRQNLRLVQMLF